MQVVKQSRYQKFYGINVYHYDGNPCLSDPCGLMKGWAVAFGLPFIILSFKRLLSA